MPPGAVSTFCTDDGISQKSFYELRKRVRTDGPSTVLEPRTRRPRSSPSALGDEVKARAVAVRAGLEASGLDHGPTSVHDKMRSMGLARVPSTAALARIFREAGVARHEPKKKPRSAWRRFVYPAPNACWQLDSTEYVLTGGRRCVILLTRWQNTKDSRGESHTKPNGKQRRKPTRHVPNRFGHCLIGPRHARGLRRDQQPTCPTAAAPELSAPPAPSAWTRPATWSTCSTPSNRSLSSATKT